MTEISNFKEKERGQDRFSLRSTSLPDYSLSDSGLNRCTTPSIHTRDQTTKEGTASVVLAQFRDIVNLCGLLSAMWSVGGNNSWILVCVCV